MPEIKTLTALVAAVLTSHGLRAEDREGQLILYPLSADELVHVCRDFSVSLHDDVVETLKLESLVGKSRKFRIFLTTFAAYDSMFWHFNNGYTGVDEYFVQRFETICRSNKVLFVDKTDPNVLLSPRRFATHTPDRVVLWEYSLVLALATLETYQLPADELASIDINTITRSSTLCHYFGLTVELFRQNLANFKGLSKSCGDWANVENRTALFELSSLLEVVGTTIKAPYDMCAKVALDKLSHEQRVKLAVQTRTYYRQYGEIVTVILSLVVGAIMSDDYTPSMRIRSVNKIISTYGRIVHTLYVQMRDIVETQYGITNN